MYGRLLVCKLHVAEVLSIVFLLRFCREEDVGPFDSFAVCIGDTDNVLVDVGTGYFIEVCWTVSLL